MLPDVTKTSALKRAEELRKICADICIHTREKLKKPYPSASPPTLSMEKMPMNLRQSR
ncbi:hypothetical protein [Candidatus Villigracilis proximus]|uniref:hypothetical protein n=1 Tax=Candidatus Villigracilis proximus TaxID=3140683 RepID=UPI0031EF936C